MLATLAYFAEDLSEKEALVRMTTKDGKDEFHNFIVEPQRTITELLEHFSSIKIPFFKFDRTVAKAPGKGVYNFELNGTTTGLQCNSQCS